MPRATKTNKKSPNSKESTEDHGEANGDDANVGANEEATQESLAQSITLFTRELQDFKKDLKHDFEELKDEVKKNMKDDFKQFKEEMMLELQAQKNDIAEAQTRIADLETVCLEMKDTLIDDERKQSNA